MITKVSQGLNLEIIIYFFQFTVIKAVLLRKLSDVANILVAAPEAGTDDWGTESSWPTRQCRC